MRFLSVHVENKKKRYRTTAKGYSYIENYLEMVILLKPQELEIPIVG